MKKPEEIKKGLFVCSDPEGNCPYCPYAVNGRIEPEGMCVKELVNDVYAYIQQLESKLNQAVEDFRRLGSMGANICPVCAHYNRGAGCPDKCPNALKEDCFEWRGTVTKEG